jgi:hypothetical protein
MLIVVKIIAILLAIMVISKTFYDLKRKQENWATFLFWVTTGLLIVYASIWPNFIYKLFANSPNENIGIGTLVGIVFVFLFFIIYRIYTKANRLERQIREIVMEIGIQNISENSRSKKKKLYYSDSQKALRD